MSRDPAAAGRSAYAYPPVHISRTASSRNGTRLQNLANRLRPGTSPRRSYIVRLRTPTPPPPPPPPTSNPLPTLGDGRRSERTTTPSNDSSSAVRRRRSSFGVWSCRRRRGEGAAENFRHCHRRHRNFAGGEGDRGGAPARAAGAIKAPLWSTAVGERRRRRGDDDDDGNDDAAMVSRRTSGPDPKLIGRMVMALQLWSRQAIDPHSHVPPWREYHSERIMFIHRRRTSFQCEGI